ncbi:MAG TPA: PAS domain-containing protein, partial [Syntrophales bacterium]|nr:PAS domain-containing protein [Syntrophales bacterium]
MPHDERTLRAILEGSPIPTFVIGKDHRVIYWNRALEELSKIKAEDVIGTRKQWRAFYRSERPCMADLICDETLETVPDWYSGKYNKSRLLEEAYEATDFFPELGKEGRWLRFTAAPIRDAAGELVGAIETLEDITERKKAE